MSTPDAMYDRAARDLCELLRDVECDVASEFIAWKMRRMGMDPLNPTADDLLRLGRILRAHSPRSRAEYVRLCVARPEKEP